MKHHNIALKVAKAITKGLKDELTNIGPGNPEEHADPRHTQRWACRGAASRMLQNLWYEVFDPSVRKVYDYQFDRFLIACEWPE